MRNEYKELKKSILLMKEVKISIGGAASGQVLLCIFNSVSSSAVKRARS